MSKDNTLKTNQEKVSNEFNVSQKFKENLEKKRKLNDSDSGLTKLFANDVSAEIDTCLQGQQGSIAFKRMASNDSVIGGILRSYENPIQSAKWSMNEIPDATPREQEVLGILNDWFFDRNNFGSQLTQILTMLPIGFSLFEKYFTLVEFEQGKFMMPILEERVQTSIRRIDYVEGLVEQNATRGGLVEIPFNDLVFFTFRQVANDRRGTSLLRQAYNDFLDKKEIKKAGTKGIIRSMIGLVMGTVPETVNSNSETFDDFNDLIIELGERDYNGLSDSAIKQAGYEIEILNSDFDLDKLKNYIAYLDSSMTMSVLTQFMTLGQGGGGGSYSLGRDGSDMLLDGLQFIVDYIEKTFSQQIIHQVVAMNWSDVDPKKFNIIGSNLDKKNAKEFIDTLAVMIEKGMMKVEPNDEVLLRKMYGMPEVDMEEREEKEEAEALKAAEELKVSEELENNQQSIEDEEKPKEKIKLSEDVEVTDNWTTAKERIAYKKQETEKLTKFATASLSLIADEFSSAIRRQLNQGKVDAQGLKDLKINNVGGYKKKLGRKLAGIANQSWKNALKNSKGKIKLAEIKPSDLPTNVLSTFVINQADIMSEKQINDIREAAILQANTGATKGLPVNNNMAMVEKVMDDYISNKNRIAGGNELAVVQSMNYGEKQYYESIEDHLWGYRFANDVPETQICKDLVGKTYPLNSSELDMIQPPLHFRCDSFLVPIYKGQEPKPEFDNFVPSDSIMKQKTI